MIELRWRNPLGGRIGSFRLLPNYCDVRLGAGGCYSVFVTRHTRPKVHYWNMMRKVWTHLFKVVRHGGCQKRSVEIPRGNLALAIHDVLFWLWWVFELLASNNNNNNNQKKKKNLLISEIHRSEIVWGDSLSSRISVFCLCGFLIFSIFSSVFEEFKIWISNGVKNRSTLGNP